MFRSTDSGATWERASAGIFGRDVDGLVVDPNHPTTVFAGTMAYSGLSTEETTGRGLGRS